MKVAPELRCRAHGLPLACEAEEVESSASLRCDGGCAVPVVGGIPRFVETSNYASGFGLQWNAFRKTQLDSHTGTTISRERLARCLGGSLETVAGKSVLEVGCGAGRFTELMLAADARVFACDLSQAVEANYANCRHFPDYFVCQADVRSLPAAQRSFDFVVCLGVIQHTPDPEETIAALARQLKPGGTLVIDHYTHGYPANFAQRTLRKLFTSLPPRAAKASALAVARALVVLHRLSWSEGRGRWRLRRQLRKLSPLIDYYEAYPQLGDKLLAEWALLDTHDTLTDHYKHLRTADEIARALRECGLRDVEVSYGGNGVEARARAPLAEGAREPEVERASA
ncbi:MAG TPA: class I SAM-dependent methyltransferase [Pyrinomonadaceae bacterium]|nr:class I SAM-dependent methyltransferase [Pyrinomonadaceae bacterium]